MRFDSEKELEDLILEEFERTGKVIIDDSTPETLLRQVSLGDYGVADLVSFSVCPETPPVAIVHIYELKNGPVTLPALSQICRYKSAIEDCFAEIYEISDVDIDMTLVGTSVDESCYIIQATGMNYFEVSLDYKTGVNFKCRSTGWHRGGGDPGKSVSDQVYGMLVDYKPRAKVNE